MVLEETHQRKLPKALTTVTIINISINQTQTFSGKVKKKDFDDIVSCMVYKGILSCFPLIKKKHGKSSFNGHIIRTEKQNEV